MKFFRILSVIVAVVLVTVSFWVGPASAQTGGGAPSMRAFVHVFLSMAAAWIILGVWVWFMALRLDRLLRERNHSEQ